MNIFPALDEASAIDSTKRTLYIGAYGFEDRSVGWAKLQLSYGSVIDKALLVKYRHVKGRNRVAELKKLVSSLGNPHIEEMIFDLRTPHENEEYVEREISAALVGIDECILDVSAMTKLLMLLCLCKLANFKGSVRIVYTEAEDYAPTKEECDLYLEGMTRIAKFPTRGVESIIRTKCLGSSRMQGQPVCLVAFISFNEQLIRHMLGSISPHHMILINGSPPRSDYKWREGAMLAIHKTLVDNYPSTNIINAEGLLERVVSTLDYRETIEVINGIYNDYGIYERILCAATGSKLQTVGLFFAKMMHPDIHIEYPTPDSYFVKEYSKGIKQVHEIFLPIFADFTSTLQYMKSGSGDT